MIDNKIFNQIADISLEKMYHNWSGLPQEYLDHVGCSKCDEVDNCPILAKAMAMAFMMMLEEMVKWN